MSLSWKSVVTEARVKRVSCEQPSSGGRTDGEVVRNGRVDTKLGPQDAYRTCKVAPCYAR